MKTRIFCSRCFADVTSPYAPCACATSPARVERHVNALERFAQLVRGGVAPSMAAALATGRAGAA